MANKWHVYRGIFLRLFALILLALSLPLGLSVAWAQTPDRVLWQIGTQDRDDKEFALAPDQWKNYNQDSFYIIGKSQPGRDWNYVQPGPDDGWAGGRSHTAQISFALTHAVPRGTCRLTLALVDTHSSAPPQIQISLNGKSWIRDTIRGAGDDSINGQPSHGSPSTIDVEFPAGTLTLGLNTLQITSLKGSWIIYDSVTMTAPRGDILGDAPGMLLVGTTQWLPDILKRHGNTLQQILRLTTFNSGRSSDVELHVSGEPIRALTVPSGRQTVELDYPEAQRSTQSHVQLFADGQPLGNTLILDRKPCRRYTIYCLEQSHMDIGYAYLQQKALALHQQYLETGLRLNTQDAGLPDDDRFRWNIESLYEVDEWLKQASPAQVGAFRTAVRTGNLGLSALYCNELTGLCRPEELAALLACANSLRVKYQIPIDSAMITDVPGYTWGLVPMLAQSGVKYISWGPNGGDHIGYAADFNNKAFYWISPSGNEKVLVWQGPNAYYPDFSASEASLTQFLINFERENPSYPYDMIYDRHTQADNGPADLALAPFVADWNQHYAFPHLVMSTTSHMFHDFAARYGSQLARVSGDYTGYWEDGAASTACETAINRQSAEALSQDQILYSLLSPKQYPVGRFANAWKNVLLYDEHTWGADRSWSDPESDFTKQQWEYKRQFALNARAEAQSLRRDALRTIATSDKSNTIAIFNASSWARSGLIVLPAAMSRAGNVVRNEQGNLITSQRLSDGSLAFLATNVPALGSRKYHISAGAAHARGSACAAQNRIGTNSLSLRIDPQTGVIAHWNMKVSIMIWQRPKTVLVVA